MLKKWSVENFKSINGRIDLDLGRLTILAGSNSSGKSTILHSILLAKQTLRYAPANRPLALNGPILKLGFFNEVKHSDSRETHIGFGCEFTFAQSAKYEAVDRRHASLKEKFESIALESKFEVSGSSEIAQLQPILRYSGLTSLYRSNTEDEIELDENGDEIDSGGGVPRRLTFVIDSPRQDSNSDDKVSSEGRDSAGETRILYRVASLDLVSEAEICEDKAEATVAGARAHHFLPAQVIVRFDQAATRAQRLAQRLASVSEPSRFVRFDHSEDRIPVDLLQYLSTFLRDHGFEQIGQQSLLLAEGGETTVPFSEAIKFLRTNFRVTRQDMPPGFERSLRGHVESQARIRATLQEPAVQQEMASRIAGRLGSKFIRVTGQTDQQVAVISYVTNFIGSRTKYIGPLRDEPKPLYPLEEVADPSDVGYRGEHTAAVLELNRWTWISFVPPPSVDGEMAVLEPHSDYLIGAVTRWLEYLGVATEVNTSDMGKFGHQMRVRTDQKSKPHDLTNVGVGVSQVLPIVVMALLAPQDSLLIFEQPELHLNPRVQSRLADFFIGVSMQGKQCIIETHSEYMIQRLRRRIAEAENNDLQKDIRVYFVQRRDGASSYRPIAFSEFGAISDWPADFFDQSDREVEEILSAAARKRARFLKKG